MYKDFTALTKPIHEVFFVADRKGILPSPVATRRFNNDELCKYYKQKFHSTQECYPLWNVIEDAIIREWLKEFIDRNASCKEEKPSRKRKHDDDGDEVDEDDEKPVQDAGKAQAQADRDKNYLGIVYTIVGGPSASNYFTRSLFASISSNGKGK